ncbi:MAG TPA: hypothetical protein VG326_14435 [Tepidisphaeraceae bacterium]|nr:hypothetical protein [Tepidisphaeraceae bacterium]
MRIQSRGADRTLTGSSHFIEFNGLRLFLDVRLYQGPRDEARRINASFRPTSKPPTRSFLRTAIWTMAASSPWRCGVCCRLWLDGLWR